MEWYAFLALLISSAALAADIPFFVNVSGKSEWLAQPDTAYIICGVSTVHAKPDSAVARTSRRSKVLLAIAGKYGIDKSGIATEINLLEKEYRNNKDTATYLGVKSESLSAPRMEDRAISRSTRGPDWMICWAAFTEGTRESRTRGFPRNT